MLTLDYSGETNSNARNYLLSALEHAGWRYAETSAMYVECTDMRRVLLGLEMLARYLDKPGQVSACTVTIQLVGPERNAPGAMSSSDAYEAVMGCPLPSEQEGEHGG